MSVEQATQRLTQLGNAELLELFDELDRLTRDEFERRYSAMPHVKKAELVDGDEQVGHVAGAASQLADEEIFAVEPHQSKQRRVHSEAFGDWRDDADDLTGASIDAEYLTDNIGIPSKP